MALEHRPKLQLLNSELRELIIEQGMEVLAKVGVVIENEEARSLLSDAGAEVAASSQKVKISQSMVESALKTAPSRIEVFDRDGEPALDLQGDNVHFDPGSAALSVLDWDTQKERTPVTADIINFARLTNALEHLHAQSTGIIAGDVPKEISDRYRLFIGLTYCKKPVVTGTFTVEGFEVMKDMLVAIRGSEAQLAKKPLAIFDCCPSPPLKWSNLTCQSLIDCARYNIPSELVSMPLTGGTAPATLTGALVQHTAESLSGVVICQLANTGAPIIYGGSPSAMDMRTGTTPMGAVETMMIDSSYAQIGKRLGLPTHAYMGLSDAKVLDFQAGMETAMGALLAVLSGINVISGPGMLDFESCQCLEKLVIDNDICGAALRLIKGVKVYDKKLGEDLFGAIYEGDHFLTSENTLKYFREELFVPSAAIDRDNYQSRQSLGEPTAGERAHRIVTEKLAEPLTEVVSDEVFKELSGIMRKDAAQYGITSLPTDTL